MATRFATARSAFTEGFEARAAIAEGDFTPFLQAFIFALAKDGLLDLVPIFGEFIGVFITIYLFIFLWGKGRMKLRIILFIVSALELIPFVNLIPFQTVCVLYAYYQARKEFEELQRVLESEEDPIARQNREMFERFQQHNREMTSRWSAQTQKTLAQVEAEKKATAPALPSGRRVPAAAVDGMKVRALQMRTANDARYAEGQSEGPRRANAA